MSELTSKLETTKNKLKLIQSDLGNNIYKKGVETSTPYDTLSLSTENVNNINWEVPSTGIRFNSGLTSFNTIVISTSNVVDMSNMFNGCEGLTELDLNDWNVSNVTNMSNMFSNCKGLTTINIDDWDVSNVIYMTNMFSSCKGLTELDLTNLKCDNVSSTNYMFSSCSGLTSLNLEGCFKTSSLISLQGMFQYCSNLTSLNVSGWDVSNVNSVSSMFQYCSSLTSLDLSSWNLKPYNKLDNMFASCSNLTSLDLSSFDTSRITSTMYMFRDCSSLRTLNVKGWDVSNITNYYYMFSGCTSLSELMIGEVDDDTYNWWVNVLEDSDKPSSIIIRDNAESGEDPNKTLLMSFEFTGDSTTFKVNNTTYTATSSPYLVYKEDLGIDKVIRWSGCFQNNTQLTKVTNFGHLSDTYNIAYLFDGCTNLESVCDLITDKYVETTSNLFKNCSKLTHINIDFNGSMLYEIGGMFNNCSALEELTILNANLTTVYDGDDYFLDGCTSLRKINVGNISQAQYEWWIRVITNYGYNIELDYTIV